MCNKLKVPLVYDVHHHRCLPDGAGVAETTCQALLTWNREPLFHLSSPINGWNRKDANKHHDYIDPKDFPDVWRALDITVEIEAKAKELAVIKLMQAMGKKQYPGRCGFEKSMPY